jgi:hypothetical protein
MAKPLNETIRHIYVETGQGPETLLNAASDGLAEVVKGVSTHGKSGRVILQIDVRKATAGAMAIKGKVTIKKPEDEPMESLMWPTPEGNLLTEDPAQTKLDFKPVAVESTTMKTIDNQTPVLKTA